MPRRVYLHIGLMKTGTSSIQHSLWLSREQLEERGFSVPGDHRLAQRHAVWDLLGRRVAGAQQRGVPGSWRRLAEQIGSSQADACLVSDELLVHARPRHVRRIARSLAPAELHVVVTVRNLAAAVGSMWQQEIGSGATWPWHDFASAVGDPESGAPTAGVAFWLRYDLARMLGIWNLVVPAQRVHVVVVPRTSEPRDRLLDLYAEAVGLEPGDLTHPERAMNPALGPARTELLRRLNVQLGGRLNEQQYLQLTTQVLRPALRGTAPTQRSRLPAAAYEALERRSRALVSTLERSQYHIAGNLKDLLLDDADRDGVDPGETSESELLADAMTSLAVVSERLARQRTRRSAAADPAVGRWARLLSSTRATGFRARTAALERADSNRGLAWASRRYLRGRT